jgi:hypothetical protein
VELMNKHRRKHIHEIADSLSQLKLQIDALYGEESAAFIKIQKSMRNMSAYEISKNAVDMLESASLRVENAIAFLEDAEG